jgi:hypothetical protein
VPVKAWTAQAVTQVGQVGWTGDGVGEPAWTDGALCFPSQERLWEVAAHGRVVPALFCYSLSSDRFISIRFWR